jgi:biopolymer transport protein ExbD
MARIRKRSDPQAGELNLTAMIDVAFQLLSFFVIAAHPVDVVAHLDILRPGAPVSGPVVSLVEITVYRGGYLMQKRPVALADVDRQLTKLAGFNPNQAITIKCTEDSTHDALVQVLDLCAKAQLTQVSVFSL